jgi:predicted Fe-Mo cluster-binding NifX family protein
MTKIAIASNKQMTIQHFGHCEYFKIVEIDNENIIKNELINNPNNACGFLPDFLNSLGVDVVICASIGERPFMELNVKNIEVITGAFGSVKSAIDSYINGTIKTAGTFCKGHQHHCYNEN